MTDERGVELKEEAKFSQRMAGLKEEAREKSGDPNMATGPALVYLAERGHEEAALILNMMILTDPMDTKSDGLAAAREHPDWEIVDEKDATLRCTNPKSDVDTPDKLVEWYRRTH